MKLKVFFVVMFFSQTAVACVLPYPAPNPLSKEAFLEQVVNVERALAHEEYVSPEQLSQRDGSVDNNVIRAVIDRADRAKPPAWNLNSKKIWALRDADCAKTIAHHLAESVTPYNVDRFAFMSDKNVLGWRDDEGVTVAHRLAFAFSAYRQYSSWKVFDQSILSLKDDDGNSVAHVLADFSGYTAWTTTNQHMLALTNNNGVSVKTILKCALKKGLILKNAPNAKCNLPKN